MPLESKEGRDEGRQRKTSTQDRSIDWLHPVLTQTRNKSQDGGLYCPARPIAHTHTWARDRTATQVCALTRNQTHNLLVTGRCSNQLSHTGYGSVITFNVNGLTVPIKRHRVAKWIRKQHPYIFCLQETLQLERHTQSENK